MTTAKPVVTTPKFQRHFAMPDPPEREPDEMTSFNHLSVTGGPYLLTHHFGNPDTILIGGEHYISGEPTHDMEGLRYPDLLIAFDVDPAAYCRSNAYIISEQGKPPDFVLEIASHATGRQDTREKRDDYAALGIPEYWRFDETGRYHRARLAGDRLVDGMYVPIPIEGLEEGVLQGYSAALNLNLRWEHGQLGWHDPETGRHIRTYEDLQGTVDSEREARIQAEARANNAETRVRELEEELRRLHDS